jgi:hypothetical protein
MNKVLAASAILLTSAMPVMATPFVDIETYWRVYLPFGTPAGISIACENGATPLATGGQPGCIDFFSLDKTVTTSSTLSATQTAYVALTNNTGALYTGVNASGDEVPGGIVLGTAYAGVYPGGDLGIDDAATESASFTSSVNGDGVESSYSCSLPGSTGSFTDAQKACQDGIGTADVSEGAADAGDLDGLFSDGIGPGTTIYLPYVSTITADFTIGSDPPPARADPVPEPSSLACFGLFLMGIVMLGASKILNRG